jgi:hypothetical protein
MAVAGLVVTISLDGTFLVAGLGMAALTLLALLSATIRRMGLAPTLDEADEPPAAQTAEGTESAAPQPAAAG